MHNNKNNMTPSNAYAGSMIYDTNTGKLAENIIQHAEKMLKDNIYSMAIEEIIAKNDHIIFD